MKKVFGNIPLVDFDFSKVIENRQDKIRVSEFLQSFVFLIVATAIAYFYQIESDLNLPLIMVIATVGFMLSAFTPIRFRLPLFLLINLSAIVLLFGWVNGGVLILLGILLVLIGCLNISFSLKILLTIGSTLLLAGIRTSFFTIPLLEPTMISVLGGLFMFRMILYLFEVKHEKEPSSLLQRISYFFLLPNLIFMIFPIVDYKTFTRNYFRRPASLIYRKGLTWILRGLWHLMLYRIIYYYIMPNPIDINDIYSLMLYLAASYALIIRLSGIFHLSVGIICLFGFDLPKTFDNYFLSSGFSDLWRRINIYWKDMVMKVFYFPIFFKFKNRNSTAMVTTVLVVFVINWFLHAFQWFWIRGVFPIRITDILFWAIFGILVAANSVLQNNSKKKYAKSSKSFKIGPAILLALKIVGMFSFVSILWSFWNGNTIAEWVELMKSAGEVSLKDIFVILSGLSAILILGVLANYLSTKKMADSLAEFYYNYKGINFQLALMLLWIIPSLPSLKSNLESKFQADLSPVFESKLNEFDEEQMFKGYYESLIVSNSFSSRIWEVEKMKEELEPPVINAEKQNGIKKDKSKAQIKDAINLRHTPLVLTTKDLSEVKLKPNLETSYQGEIFTTNSFGLRDQEYSLRKSEEVTRIGLLGGSIEMGSGVANDEIFEALAEEMLRKDFQEKLIHKKVEILNFAISGQHLSNQVAIFNNNALQFSPDKIIYSWHPTESFRNLKTFSKVMKTPIINEYPELKKIADESGIMDTKSRRAAEKALVPFQYQLMEWGIGIIAKGCRERNISPYWLYLDMLGNNQRSVKDNMVEVRRIFSKYGFEELNLMHVYEDQEKDQLKVGQFDNHPNAKGHALIAEEFYKLLKAKNLHE